MRLDSLIDDEVRIIGLPFPLFADWILVMTPAEHALVGTRQAWRCFHALVRCYPIERMFVTSSSSTQLMLRPSTELHSAVSSDQLVAFLLQCLCLGLRDHFSWFRLAVDSDRAFFIVIITIVFLFVATAFDGFAHILHVNNIGFWLLRLLLILIFVIGNELWQNVMMQPRLQHPIFVANCVISHSDLAAHHAGAKLAEFLECLLCRHSHRVVIVIRTAHAQDADPQLLQRVL
mmetsp:Transcript_23723/g.66997  ORF Transcript_23723/g.66997 Transcript_23723/m.66997 type:complete len:232 (-) Transcript_23723:598-1293(-)